MPLDVGGRQMGVTLPAGQGQDRIQETHKVLFIGKPMELRPLKYSDEYGRVHDTVVYVTKDEGAADIYLYPPTEDAVKRWRPVTRGIKEQINAVIASETEEIPKQDAVEVVAQEVAKDEDHQATP